MSFNIINLGNFPCKINNIKFACAIGIDRPIEDPFQTNKIFKNQLEYQLKYISSSHPEIFTFYFDTEIPESTKNDIRLGLAYISFAGLIEYINL